MRQASFALLAGGVISCLSGCGWMEQPGGSSDATQGGVAVIDLDKVAKALGRDVEISRNVQQAADSVNQQLGVIRTSAIEKLKGLQSELGEQPSEEDQKDLKIETLNTNTQLKQVARKAQTELARYRNGVINQFREEVKPVASDVAQSKGLSIVVSKNEAFLFAFNPAVDITDEVAQRMLALQPPRTREPAPLAPQEATPMPQPQTPVGSRQPQPYPSTEYPEHVPQTANLPQEPAQLSPLPPDDRLR